MFHFYTYGLLFSGGILYDKMDLRFLYFHVMIYGFLTLSGGTETENWLENGLNAA